MILPLLNERYRYVIYEYDSASTYRKTRPVSGRHCVLSTFKNFITCYERPTEPTHNIIFEDMLPPEESTLLKIISYKEATGYELIDLHDPESIRKLDEALLHKPSKDS